MPQTEASLLAAIALLAAMPLAAQETPADEETQEEVEAGPLEISGQISEGLATIPDGTRVELVLIEELSSKRARKGDLVRLAVAHDHVVGETIVIPEDTIAIAEITAAESSGMMGRGGKLAARALYLELPGGPARLSGELSDSGSGKTALATIVTGLVGVGIFIKGKEAVLPEGTRLMVLLDREARIPLAGRDSPE